MSDPVSPMSEQGRQTPPADAPAADGSAFQAFLTDRLQGQIAYFNKAAAREQERGKLWQNVLIVAAAATPLLIGLAEFFDGFQTGLRALALGSSFLAAVATSLLSVRQYWENGVGYRAQEQALIRERVLYDTKAGPYAPEALDGADPRTLLVETVEAIVAKDVTGWQARMQEASQRSLPKKPKAPAKSPAISSPASPAPDGGG